MRRSPLTIAGAVHPVSTVAHRRDRNRDHADPHPPAPAERPGAFGPQPAEVKISPCQSGASEDSNTELLSRITARPDVFGGKPIIRDMRISVELILSLLAQGLTPDAILDDYPDLEADDIRACAAYAHEVITRDTPPAVSVAK